jgi:hypothetical protein
MGMHEKYYDKIYFNGELILKRKNTYEFAEVDRDFYCDSPLQLVLALAQIIDDMNDEIIQIKEHINGYN